MSKIFIQHQSVKYLYSTNELNIYTAPMIYTAPINIYTAPMIYTAPINIYTAPMLKYLYSINE